VAEAEGLKEQMSAMDEMTVSLTKENLDKENEIASLKKASDHISTSHEEALTKKQQLIARLEAKVKDMAQAHEQELESIKEHAERDKHTTLSHFE
jgi:hypothetical protein